MAPARIVKATWKDAWFEMDPEPHPMPRLVTTIGYEIPRHLVPPNHVGLAAEWLDGENYRAVTYIPEELVTLEEELQ